ncbi:hypothetical protein EIP91_007756 [Steccherinum ochraceum]|uniref:Cupin type-2 domain-containing protein n=1 Tax=Steccherinum ochraceum TaxID=92696 RepID=A0A4R0RUI6_9APHY|nr:hypothetical protein EIP91_007756 [Steccherinum ochraceum]
MSTTSYSLPNIRRVVTGHTAEAEPTIILDESVQPKFWHPKSTNGVFDLYRTEQVPANNNEVKGEWVDSIAHSLPGPAGLSTLNGATFRVFDYAPGSSVFPHRTESLDFGIIMQGSVVLDLENGESTILKQGDVIVQRGVLHSWKNPSPTEWTRIYWVVVGAKPVEVNGQVLGEDWSRRPQ